MQPVLHQNGDTAEKNVPSAMSNNTLAAGNNKCLEK